MFLDSNYVLYAGMIQVIRRGTAEILEESDEGIFLRDAVSNAFMLATDNPEISIEWLKKYEYLNYILLVLFQKDVIEFARERYGFLSSLECFQAVYMLNKPFHTSKRLQIKVATNDDYQTVSDHYKMLSEWELKKIISRRELFIGYYDEKMVGFIGQHLEGSMGLLEVLPQYRKNGYGMELEQTMINYMLEKGLIPFCQVEVTNEKSLRLQKKLGLTITREQVCWLF